MIISIDLINYKFKMKIGLELKEILNWKIVYAAIKSWMKMSKFMTSRVLQSIVVISMLDMSMFMTYFSIFSTNSSLNQIVILQHIWLFHLNELHWSSPNTRYGNKLTSAAAIHSLTDLVQFEWPVLLISNIFLFITKIKFCLEGIGCNVLNK